MRPSVQVIDIVKIVKVVKNAADPLILCGVHVFASFSPPPRSYQGGFAKVKLGRHILTGEKVAIKVMNKKDLGVSIAEAQCRSVL